MDQQNFDHDGGLPDFVSVVDGCAGLIEMLARYVAG
jgi:hypothetical protein